MENGIASSAPDSSSPNNIFTQVPDPDIDLRQILGTAVRQVDSEVVVLDSSQAPCSSGDPCEDWVELEKMPVYGWALFLGLPISSLVSKKIPAGMMMSQSEFLKLLGS